LFVYGAAMGDPMCYFRMSQMYIESNADIPKIKMLNYILSIWN